MGPTFLKHRNKYFHDTGLGVGDALTTLHIN